MAKINIDLKGNIAFYTLVREAFPCQCIALSLDEEESQCILTIKVELQYWTKIWEEELFQLCPPVINYSPLEFEEEGVLEIALELQKVVLFQVLKTENPAQSILDSLLAKGVLGDLLQHCASWRALSVLQEIEVPFDPDSKVSIGFQTIWGSD